MTIEHRKRRHSFQEAHENGHLAIAPGHHGTQTIKIQNHPLPRLLSKWLRIKHIYFPTPRPLRFVQAIKLPLSNVKAVENVAISFEIKNNKHLPPSAIVFPNTTIQLPAFCPICCRVSPSLRPPHALLGFIVALKRCCALQRDCNGRVARWPS